MEEGINLFHILAEDTLGETHKVAAEFKATIRANK